MRSLDTKQNEIPELVDLERAQLDGCRLLPRVVVGKRSEVVEAHETFAELTHSTDVDIVFDPPDKRLGERGASTRDLVDVGARASAVTGVKSVPHFLNAEDVDIRGELVVDAAHQRVG